MKKLLFTFHFLLFTFHFATAQKVGIGTNTPNPSAQLDVTSTNKGFLPPRMTYAQRNAILNPAAGLIVYCTDCGAKGEWQSYNGTEWKNMIGGPTQAALAVLTTTAVSSIAETAAISGGNITSDGGGTVTARGVVWSTSPNPTVALTTKTSNGSGTGIFTGNITGLTAGTMYYLRAYATNGTGTAYGNELTFVTKNCDPAQVNLSDFFGTYNNTYESFATDIPTGPYTTRVIEVKTLTSTTGEIVVENLWNSDNPVTPAYDGWKPIRFKLDWTNPSNPLVTLDQQTGIGDASTVFGPSNSGKQLMVRAHLVGGPGTFNYCNQGIVLKLQLGIVGVGWASGIYEVKLGR